MRQRKWRAYLKVDESLLPIKHQRMYYSVTPHGNEERGIYYVGWRSWTWELNKEAFLMDYVGLPDKNGVEIYEGDYLLEDDPDGPVLYEVIWRDDEAGFVAWNEANNLMMNVFYCKNIIKIVGNIYEGRLDKAK